MNKRNIEAIYRLSPAQQALLVHRVARGVDDTGLLQVRFDLRGPLDLDAWRQAWLQLVARHAALRMTLQVADQQQPLLVQWKKAELPCTVRDWASANGSERDVRLEKHCRQDRERGLDLAQLPASRLELIHFDDDDHHVVWTCHHLLLDGWSSAIALRDLLELYHSVRQRREPVLPKTAPLRSYYQWLKTLDSAQTEQYWRAQLRGFQEPTPLGSPQGHQLPATPTALTTCRIELPPALTEGDLRARPRSSNHHQRGCPGHLGDAAVGAERQVGHFVRSCYLGSIVRRGRQRVDGGDVRQRRPVSHKYPTRSPNRRLSTSRP